MPRGIYERYTSAQIKELHAFLKKNHAMPRNPKRARAAGRRLKWKPSKPVKARETQPQYEVMSPLPPPPPPPAPVVPYSPPLSIPTWCIPPLSKLHELPFCTKARVLLANCQRWGTLQEERAELVKERTALVKAQELALKDLDLQLVALDREERVLIQEVNSPFRKASKEERPEDEEDVEPRPPTRNWTSKEREEFERAVEELLLGSPGLTANAIRQRLGVGPKGAHRALDQMVTEGDLRYVTVEVVRGRNSKKKMRGYAMPLKEVA